MISWEGNPYGCGRWSGVAEPRAEHYATRRGAGITLWWAGHHVSAGTAGHFSRVHPVSGFRYVPDLRYPLADDPRVRREHSGTPERGIHLGRVAECDPRP